MPTWVSGLGLSPPKPRGSPETPFDLSSSSSDNRPLVASESESGMAVEGLETATRASLRENSVISRDSRSAGSVHALMDDTARERSPRKREPIEDIPNGPYGAQRNRGREMSSLSITNQGFSSRSGRGNRSREVSRPRALHDAPVSSLVKADEDTLDEDLAGAMSDEPGLGNSPVSHLSIRPRAPTSIDDETMPSGSAQSFGPLVAAQLTAVQSNYDQSVTHQAVVSSDQRSVTINNGLTLDQADALVQHEVERTETIANIAYDALSNDARTAISSLSERLQAAVQSEIETRELAERQADLFSKRERELSEETSKLINKADAEVRKGRDEQETARLAATKRFDALAQETERRRETWEEDLRNIQQRLSETETRLQDEEARVKALCDLKVEEERRRAAFDLSNKILQLQEELSRERETSRRLQVDLEDSARQEQSKAERLQNDLTRRSSEQILSAETMQREILKLQSEAAEAKRIIPDLQDRCATLGKALTECKAEMKR